MNLLTETKDFFSQGPMKFKVFISGMMLCGIGFISFIAIGCRRDTEPVLAVDYAKASPVIEVVQRKRVMADTGHWEYFYEVRPGKWAKSLPANLELISG